jgi:hypothetical protein
MNEQNWETARSVKNGGTLSFTEAAEAWKNRPADFWYPLGTDETDKWITKSFLDSQRARTGVIAVGGHVVNN